MKLHAQSTAHTDHYSQFATTRCGATINAKYTVRFRSELFDSHLRRKPNACNRCITWKEDKG